MTCRAAEGGAHAWSKPDRQMVQRCVCGAERRFPPHAPQFKRMPPQLGARNLIVCKVCGYVKDKNAPLGVIEARLHVETE